MERRPRGGKEGGGAQNGHQDLLRGATWYSSSGMGGGTGAAHAYGGKCQARGALVVARSHAISHGEEEIFIAEKAWRTCAITQTPPL